MTQLIRATRSVLLKERPRRHLQKSWRDTKCRRPSPRAALRGEDQSRSRRNRAERFSTRSWRVGPQSHDPPGGPPPVPLSDRLYARGDKRCRRRGGNVTFFRPPQSPRVNPTATSKGVCGCACVSAPFIIYDVCDICSSKQVRMVRRARHLQLW